jgi:hypothetical protein
MEVVMSDFGELVIDYELPVAELLSVGDESLSWGESFDYRKDFGLSLEHVPELLRMAADEELNQAESDSLRVWAPIHAIRALGQLRAAEAVNPLLELIVRDRHDDDAEFDDWLHPEVTVALSEIGAPAVPAVARLVMDAGKDRHSRVAAARVLSRVGRNDFSSYPQCVAALATALESFKDNDPALNGFLIGCLADLDAEETCWLIEQAFSAGVVDETVAGDWEDVQIELGRMPPLSEDALRQKVHRRFGIDEISERFGEIVWKMLERKVRRFTDSDGEPVDDLDGEPSLEPPPEPEEQVRMTMPEEIYTADERRQLARERVKRRKAAQRAKAREKQSKKSR